MKMDDFSPVRFDQSWVKVLSPFESQLKSIEKSLEGKTTYPSFESAFRALTVPLENVRVVIFGQDPYPTPGNATGFAFAVPTDVKIPASLRNIFKEYQEDLGRNQMPSSDLSQWSNQGVLLLNRALTYSPDGHLSTGDWFPITNAIAQELGERDVVAILWGNDARNLKHYFRSNWVIESAHPSPLSAYRGFFGSKPFSRTNEILEKNNLPPITW
jgi:uracil-DNA glycosylase